MDWQQPASLAVVAFAGFFFLRHQILLRRKSRSRICASECACGAGEERGPGTGEAHALGGESGGTAGTGNKGAAS